MPSMRGVGLPRLSLDWLISTTWAKVLLSLILGGGLGLVVAGASAMSTERMFIVVAVMLVPFLLLIAGGIRRPLLAVIMIEMALDITSYVNFQQPDRGQISGYTVSLTTLALCGLYAIWFAELLAKQTQLPQGVWRMALPPLCYVLLATVTSLWAPSFIFATFEVFQIWHALLLFIYLAATVRTREDLIFIVLMVGVGIIIQSFGQIFVYVTGRNISIGPLSTVATNTYIDEYRLRPGGFIGSPIDAVALYEIYLPLLIAFLFIKAKPLYTWFVLFALSFGAIGFVLAQSRMGWLALALSCAIVGFFAWRRGILPLWVPILALLAGLVMVGVFQEMILSRFTTDDNGSARSRVIMTELGLQVLRDYPIFGVGINNFAAVVKHYLTPDFTHEWFYAIHDKYLLLWVEIGLPGLAAFVTFLLVTVRRSWLAWQLRDPTFSPLALGLGAGMLGQMIHMFVDVFHSKPQVQGLWVAAALIAAMCFNFKDEPSLSSDSLPGRLSQKQDVYKPSFPEVIYE